MNLVFNYFMETKRTYIFQQPRHLNTNLVTTDLYIKKEEYPNGPPTSITVTIEEAS